MIKTKFRQGLCILICCGVLLAASAGYLFYLYALPGHISEEEMALRQQFVASAEKWLGCNEEDGSHKPIIDLYNSHTPLARGYAVQYTDAWCAAFVSAVAIDCGLTDIIPTECGCEMQIRLFQELGRWQEKDNYTPAPGDLIFYSTKGSSDRHNTGWADHVGIVVSVEGSVITTIEGNYGDRVTYRTITIGNELIRGYGLPDFASDA